MEFQRESRGGAGECDDEDLWEIEEEDSTRSICEVQSVGGTSKA